MRASSSNTAGPNDACRWSCQPASPSLMFFSSGSEMFRGLVQHRIFWRSLSAVAALPRMTRPGHSCPENFAPRVEVCRQPVEQARRIRFRWAGEVSPAAADDARWRDQPSTLERGERVLGEGGGAGLVFVISSRSVGSCLPRRSMYVVSDIDIILSRAHGVPASASARNPLNFCGWKICSRTHIWAGSFIQEPNSAIGASACRFMLRCRHRRWLSNSRWVRCGRSSREAPVVTVTPPLNSPAIRPARAPVRVIPTNPSAALRSRRRRNPGPSTHTGRMARTVPRCRCQEAPPWHPAHVPIAPSFPLPG